LWDHINIALNNKIKKLNLATDPVLILELYEHIKGSIFTNEVEKETFNYNFKTKNADLFLKKASGFKNIKELLTGIHLYIGGVLYFLSVLLNIYILRFLDYSIVLTLTSITYIWTMILSYYVLHENITRKKLIGLSFVVIGAFLIVNV